MPATRSLLVRHTAAPPSAVTAKLTDSPSRRVTYTTLGLASSMAQMGCHSSSITRSRHSPFVTAMQMPPLSSGRAFGSESLIP